MIPDESSGPLAVRIHAVMGPTTHVNFLWFKRGASLRDAKPAPTLWDDMADSRSSSATYCGRTQKRSTARPNEQGEPQSSYWLASQIVEAKLWRASEADVRDALRKRHRNAR